MKSLGILGGTFDPVHNAHLAMARSALERLKVDRVLFMPTGPTKYRVPAVAPAPDRVAMLELALDGEKRFQIDARELSPQASGYTVDTLAALREELGHDTAIYFLMGADQFEKLPTWHRPDEIRKLARIAVFARPGHEVKDPGAAIVDMAPMAVSASDIRARAARGEDVSPFLPAAVAAYIKAHRLYR